MPFPVFGTKLTASTATIRIVDMINRIHLKIFLPVSLLFLCVFFLLCMYFIVFKVQFEPPPHQSNPFDDYPAEDFMSYQIDPLTIISDLQNGKKDVFHLLDKEPSNFKDIYPEGRFSWPSENYLTIAKAHHMMLTGESLENGWKIYDDGYFRVDRCQDEVKGFDSGQIIFYKETPNSFLVTYIEIRPLNGIVRSAVTEYFRQKDGQFNEAAVFTGEVTAEDALRIAEDAGGKEMRQKLSNESCYLIVDYFSGKFWSINYIWATTDLEAIISFDVNSEDGSYKVEKNVDKCDRAICP